MTRNMSRRRGRRRRRHQRSRSSSMRGRTKNNCRSESRRRRRFIRARRVGFVTLVGVGVVLLRPLRHIFAETSFEVAKKSARLASTITEKNLKKRKNATFKKIGSGVFDSKSLSKFPYFTILN